MWQGLIIDDFYALSLEPVAPLAAVSPGERPALLQRSSASSLVCRAQAAYLAEDIKGSPLKDNFGSLSFSAGGAHVDSELETVAEGQVLVGAAPSKRLALSFLTLKAAALPGLSAELCASLTGSWTSVLLYRRCLGSCLDSFFALAPGLSSTPAGSEVVALPRKASQEATMLACLAPLAVTNIAVPQLPTAFCTDASLAKGAICKTQVSEELASTLWAHAGKKGFYTKLDGHRTGPPFEEDLYPRDIGTPLPGTTADRPLGLDFDFVEVGSPGLISSFVREAGFRASPPFSCGLSQVLCVRENPLSSCFFTSCPEAGCGAFSVFFLRAPVVRNVACSAGSVLFFALLASSGSPVLCSVRLASAMPLRAVLSLRQPCPVALSAPVLLGFPGTSLYSSGLLALMFPAFASLAQAVPYINAARPSPPLKSRLLVPSLSLLRGRWCKPFLGQPLSLRILGQGSRAFL